MDAETLRRATEPFYSTEGVNNGTGLGLSRVQGLAVQSGGAIHIVSEPGEGTTVTIWLAVANRMLLRVTGTGVDNAIPECLPQHILLVDDEELVQTANAETLESLGHSVTRASLGAAALAKLRSEVAVDLLLTDHMMPSLTGLEFFAAAKTLRPELPAALITGFADQAMSDKSVRRLAKPFRIGDLARLVKDMAATEAVT